MRTTTSLSLCSSLLLGLVHCGSSSPAAQPSASSADAGASATDAGANATDAAVDATVSCNDPGASPSMNCGTLSFAKSSVESRLRNHHVTLIAQTAAGPFLFALGGANVNTSLAYVDRAPVAADGSLGAFTSATSLPVGVGGLVGEIVSGVIVVAGGTNITGSALTVTDQSYSAVVGTDGSLGAWKPAGSVLEPRMHAGSMSNGNTIWILGGFQNQSVWDDIVRATVQPDGTVSAWTSSGKLPTPRSHFSTALLNGYVYIAGGLEQSALDNPPEQRDVWRGQIQTDGTVGGWTQMPDLPTVLATQATFFYGGYLYICGGINAVALENRCWRSPIGSDHALGAWQQVASLPLARGHVHQMPVLDDHVYSIAGAIDFSLDSTTDVDVGAFQ